MTGVFLGVWLSTAFCCPPHCHLTASGVQVGPGQLAADWRVLPRGTRVVVEGFPGQVFTVTDTGADIRGNRIDIWMSDCRNAIAWGRRWVSVSRAEGVSVEAVWEELVEETRYEDDGQVVVKQLWHTNRGEVVTFEALP